MRDDHLCENCGFEKEINFHDCVNGQHYVLIKKEKENQSAQDSSQHGNEKDAK